MFLDDKLREIGMNAELTDEGVKSAINQMIIACMDNIESNLSPAGQHRDVLAVFNRIDRTWSMVANELLKKGRGFVKPDGFRIYIKSKPEFQGIYDD